MSSSESQGRRSPFIRTILGLAVFLAVVAPFSAAWLLTEASEATNPLSSLDAHTADPLMGANTVPPQATQRTDGTGHFTLDNPKKGEKGGTVPGATSDRKTLEGYLLLEEAQANLVLRSKVIAGTVLDAVSGQPIPGAWVSAGTITSKTAPDGTFRLTDVPPNAELTILAAGYGKIKVPGGEAFAGEIRLKPQVVKSIYLSFYTVAWEERREHLLDLVDKTELNAVVMDVKSDQGLVNAALGVPLAKESGAEVNLVKDMPGLLARLRAKNVYTIARIVVFKDKALASKRPDLAVKDSGTGRVYVDCEEQWWVDPYRREVWDYNIAIAERAAQLGFDEIQFDYIRFPSDCVRGSLVYSQESTAQSRMAAIEGFLAAASARLKPLGVFVGADTFGWTTVREDEMGIGQLIEGMVKHLDYLCPMVYPSTWGEGALGVDYPAAQPYEIVYRSLKRGMERVGTLPTLRIRPWLQDFHDYNARKLRYAAWEIDQQRRAAEATNTLGWMLWNAGATYTEGALAKSSP